MNILAHLHLATLANSSIIGNAGADFVKGDPYHRFEQAIADGIMMHRRVDKLIDQLAEVKQARSLFREETYRVAPITLDIIWDHFLAKHWSLFVQQSLTDFNQQMRAQIAGDIALFPEQFARFVNSLWQGQWLINYAERDFIEKVLNSMANQRHKLQTLRMTFTDFVIEYTQFETIFFSFYPQLMHKAHSLQL